MALELINSTIADGMTAATITLAMSLGLVVPKIAVDSVTKRRPRTKPPA